MRIFYKVELTNISGGNVDLIPKEYREMYFEEKETANEIINLINNYDTDTVKFEWKITEVQSLSKDEAFEVLGLGQ